MGTRASRRRRCSLDEPPLWRPPSEALPPPAAVDYAREFVRRGLPLDSLLRPYHIGQATFFRRWSTKALQTITNPRELTEAVELAANWTFDYISRWR
jgi:hypothetical protein